MDIAAAGRRREYNKLVKSIPCTWLDSEGQSFGLRRCEEDETVASPCPRRFITVLPRITGDLFDANKWKCVEAQNNLKENKLGLQRKRWRMSCRSLLLLMNLRSHCQMESFTHPKGYFITKAFLYKKKKQHFLFFYFIWPIFLFAVDKRNITHTRKPKTLFSCSPLKFQFEPKNHGNQSIHRKRTAQTPTIESLGILKSPDPKQLKPKRGKTGKKAKIKCHSEHVVRHSKNISVALTFVPKTGARWGCLKTKFPP